MRQDKCVVELSRGGGPFDYQVIPAKEVEAIRRRHDEEFDAAFREWKARQKRDAGRPVQTAYRAGGEGEPERVPADPKPVKVKVKVVADGLAQTEAESLAREKKAALAAKPPPARASAE